MEHRKKNGRSPSRTKSVMDDLISACREEHAREPVDVLASIADPNWDSAPRRNDWRNEVPDSLKELWGDLSQESRLTAYVLAEYHCFLRDRI